MTLEQELALENPFKDEQEKAIVNLLYTYNYLFSIMQTTLKPFNINDQHYNVLKIIESHHPEPIQVGTIKEMLINKRGDLTRLLDKLHKMELIDRQTNPENRRMVNISLKKAGVEALEKMDEKMWAYTQLRKNLTTEDAARLNALLDKLRGSK